MAIMSRTGLYWEILVLLTKYGIAEIEGLQSNTMRLTNQLWKLIPMRENEEDWQGHLDGVILELTGLNEVLTINATLLQLLSKLEGLRSVEIPFALYRKTVFESISLLQEASRGIAN